MSWTRPTVFVTQPGLFSLTSPFQECLGLGQLYAWHSLDYHYNSFWVGNNSLAETVCTKYRLAEQQMCNSGPCRSHAALRTFCGSCPEKVAQSSMYSLLVPLINYLPWAYYQRLTVVGAHNLLPRASFCLHNFLSLQSVFLKFFHFRKLRKCL